MGLPENIRIDEDNVPTVWSPPNVSFSGKAVGLIVLGMHHSGTSLISRMLIEMGVYGKLLLYTIAYANFSPAGEFKDLELLTGPDPDKFWERKDLCEANHDLIVDQTIRGPWYLVWTFFVLFVCS